MPLVRIDLVEGRTDTQVRTLADTFQQVIVDVLAAPERDRYQVIHEHTRGRMIADDTGLGFERTDGVALIQVTQQGRGDAQKKAPHRALAGPLPIGSRPMQVRDH